MRRTALATRILPGDLTFRSRGGMSARRPTTEVTINL
jgi:hypothetical protein